MELLNSIKYIEVYFILGLILITLILIILVFCLYLNVNKLQVKYKKMMRGSKNGNLEEVIQEYYNRFDNISSQFGKLSGSIVDINKKIEGCIQKFSIKRYKAFENVGSDLSFSIALLDEKNNGVILTGIYGREESTTYAKPVDAGISRYELSMEEKSVLENAMKEKSL